VPKLAEKTLLTDKLIKAAQPASGIVWDALVPKLGLLVSPKGQRTFVFVSRFPGSSNPAKRTLGTYPVMSLDAARTEARRWHELLGKGIDPGASAGQATTTDTGPATFATIANAFCDRIAVNKRRGHVTKRRLETLVLPQWGKLPAAEITPRQVNELIRKHVDRDCPGMARDLLTIIRRVFSWAVGTGEFDLTTSPCAFIRPGDIGAKVNKRQRKLTDDELRKFWRAADEEDAEWRCFFQLALLTAVRRSELAGMVWSELDTDDEKVWRIPAARMKMAVDHVVPLTPEMVEIISRRQGRHKAGWEHVLSSSKGRRGLTDFDAAQTRMQKRMGVYDWTLHDLRRTVRTRLSDLPVDSEVAEAILAHSKQGVEAVYNTSEFVWKKRQALNLWEACLLDVVKGKSWAQVLRDRRVMPTEAA
jgi:integrase